MKNKIMIILGSILILLFSSCKNEINDYEWEKGCKLCLEHKGLRKIIIVETNYSLSKYVECHDGKNIKLIND